MIHTPCTLPKIKSNCCKMKLLCTLFLLLQVFFLLCDALSQTCKCGQCDLSEKDNDKTLWKCQKESELDDKMIVDKLNSNEAVCLNYRVNSQGECDFREELVDFALANPIKDICHPSTDYPDRCSIHNHPEFSKKCHRSQQFCAYKIKCPTGYYHMPILTALDLPKNDDGECIDRVTIYYGLGKVITLCGSKEELNKFNRRQDRMSFHPLIVKFQSSQCCHNCGFHMWISCVPDPILAGFDSGLPYGYKLKGYQNPQKGFMFRDEKTREFYVTVPLGAKVVYKDSVVSIVKGDQSLYQFTDILSMKVVDDLFGNRTLYGSTKRDMLFGFGTLIIYKDTAVYENERIPSELKPSKLESEYIIDTVKFLVPFLINSTYKTFIEPASRVALPIIAGKLNRYKPDCQETAEITMGFPSASCKAPEYPTVRELARALAEASYLRQSSQNPFVLTVARDVIEILHEKTEVKLKIGLVDVTTP